jgi:hypothetical protein
MRHVHAELLHALAEDASLEIEYLDKDEWLITPYPRFSTEMKYRIKPEPVVYVLEQAVYYKQRGSFVRCTYHDDVLVSCEVVK